MKKCITLLSVFVFSSLITAKATEKPPIHKWTVKTPFEQKVFIENLGQYDLKKKAGTADILFGARQNGLQYFFTKDGIWIKHLEKMERTTREMEKFKKKLGGEEEDKDGEEKADNIVKFKWVDRFYRMEFVGAGVGTTITAEDKVSQYYAFHTDATGNVQAHGYKKITYKNLYPNIDMEFYFPEDKQGFKYNFILHPGADLSQIRINYPLNEGMILSTSGNLVIKSLFGDFVDHAPVASDVTTNKPVACSFELKRNTISFSVPTYDASKGLVIDPWTTTPAFAGNNNAYDVDWDNAGNAYAYGGTSPFQVIKFSPAGTPLWSYTTTFTGGGGGFYYGDFAVDRVSGSAYIVDGFNSGGAQAVKINLTGGQVTATGSNPLFQEMWRIVFSRCTNQAVIAGGGTSNPSYTGCSFDTNLVNMNVVNVINSPTGLHDMWGVAIDAFSTAYFCTAQTQVGSPGYDNIIFKVPTPALSPLTYSVPTGYSFIEVASATYAPGPPNGFNGIALSNVTLYTYDSYVLKKWATSTGANLGSTNVNGTSQSTMTTGGLTVDDCDHLFLGSGNSIKQYDGVSMTQTGTLPAAGTVYDLALGGGNILYACGAGFVSATHVNLTPCSILHVKDSITNASCSNPIGSATLTVTGGTQPYNITWNTTPVQTGTVVSNLPAGTYIATISDNSCTKQITYDTVVISQFGGVAVTPVITNVKCNGASTGSIVIQVTGTVVPTYTWSTGSNASSITNIPAGTYTVTVDGGSGCNMTISLTITQPPPLTNTLTPGILKCFGDTASISVAVTGGTPSHTAPGYTVAWNPPAATGLAVHGLGPGNYGATIKDSLGCVSTFTVGLTQPPQITPSFSYTPACFGSPIQFADLSTGGPFTNWSWNYGDASPFGTTQNPSHTYSVTGTYSVHLTVTTAGNCTATVTNTLSVFPPPVADFSGDSLSGCPLLTVNFTDHSTCSSGSISTWIWTFGNGGTYVGQSPGNSITYNNTSPTIPATYSVSLLVISSNGCSSLVVKNNYITVYPHPHAGFTFASSDGSTIDVLNNTVHFYDHSVGANAVSYYLGDIFANPLSVNYTANRNPVHQYGYGDAYTYNVTQWVQNQFGCKDSINEPMPVKPIYTYYIPNAFSPNGDNVNEGFRGTGIGIDNSTYSLLIFDRWGNQIFKANDLEKAWDGRINGKGDIVQEDIYVWKATFKDANGLSHDYHGIVSVIK